MGWLQLAGVILIAGFLLKIWNGWKHDAKAAGIAAAEKQIAESAAVAEKDASRELQRLMALRPKRAQATEKVQMTRKADDEKKRRQTPVYANWASVPVPDDVVSELRIAARAANEVHSGTDNGEPGLAVQPDSAGTAPKNGRWFAKTLRPRVD